MHIEEVNFRMWTEHRERGKSAWRTRNKPQSNVSHPVSTARGRSGHSRSTSIAAAMAACNRTRYLGASGQCSTRPPTFFPLSCRRRQIWSGFDSGRLNFDRRQHAVDGNHADQPIVDWYDAADKAFGHLGCDVGSRLDLFVGHRKDV